MLHKRIFNIPVLLFLTSLVLRLNLISLGPYHVDCLNLAIQANATLETGQLHNLFGFGYPLTVLLGSFFIWTCQLFNIYDLAFAVNLMSVVLSSLTVTVNYLFIARLINPAAAFFSSVMLSVFPIFLGLSIYGTSHIPAVLFLELGLLFLLKFKTDQRKSFLILSALSFGFMGGARIQDLVLMFVPINYFFYWCRQQNLDRKDLFISWLMFDGIIFTVAALFHLPFLLDHSSAQYTNQLSSFAHQGLFGNFLGFFSWANYSYTFSILLWNLTHVGVVLSFLGFIYLGIQRRGLCVFLFLWFLAPLLFYGNLNTTVSRFLMISALPLIIAQGYYFSLMLQFKRKIFSIICVLCFSAIVITLIAFMYPRFLFRHQFALLPEFARFVGQQTPANAQVITGGEGLFINYYGSRKIIYRPSTMEPNDLLAFHNQIDSLLADNIPVFITSSGLYSGDDQKVFSNFLNKNYRLEYRGERPTEDWHHGEIIQRIGKEKLFRIVR